MSQAGTRFAVIVQIVQEGGFNAFTAYLNGGYNGLFRQKGDCQGIIGDIADMNIGRGQNIFGFGSELLV